MPESKPALFMPSRFTKVVEMEGAQKYQAILLVLSHYPFDTRLSLGAKRVALFKMFLFARTQQWWGF